MKTRKRTVHVDEKTLAALDQQRERFRTRFGREPRPDEPLFFDPDADEPRPVDIDAARAEMVAAMQAAGVHPRLIHAFRRTGLLVSEDNIGRISPRDLAEWQAAIEEWDDLQKLSN